MYPLGYICLSEGDHLLHYRNKLTLRHKNGVRLYSSKNLKVLLKIQWMFIILLSFFVITYSKGTCSSVKMLKGYMVNKRLGIPALKV